MDVLCFVDSETYSKEVKPFAAIAELCPFNRVSVSMSPIIIILKFLFDFTSSFFSKDQIKILNAWTKVSL